MHTLHHIHVGLLIVVCEFLYRFMNQIYKIDFIPHSQIQRIISALFGCKIGTGPDLSALFRCCNYPHNSRIGIRLRICERNSKIMRIISKVWSKVTFLPHAYPFVKFLLMGARLKKRGANYFRGGSEFVNTIFIELST